MKKINLLTPILGIATLSGAVIPMVGCSCKSSGAFSISINDTTNGKLDIVKNTLDGVEVTVGVKDATKKQLNGVKVKIGEKELAATEYAYEAATGKITISKDVLAKYNGAITITLDISDKGGSVIHNMTFKYHTETVGTQDSFASEKIDVKLDKTTSYSFLMDFSLAKAKGLRLADGWFMTFDYESTEYIPLVSSGRIYLKDDTSKTADLEYNEETYDWIIPYNKISANDDSKIVFEVKFEPYTEPLTNSPEMKLSFCVNHENGQ